MMHPKCMQTHNVKNHCFMGYIKIIKSCIFKEFKLYNQIRTFVLLWSLKYKVFPTKIFHIVGYIIDNIQDFILIFINLEI